MPAGRPVHLPLLAVVVALATAVLAGPVASAAPGPPTRAAVVAPAVAPAGTVHRAYVAVVTNRGTFDAPYVTDPELVAFVEQAMEFWVAESRGAISSFEIAGYARFAATAAGCSVNDMYAAGNAQFPGISAGDTVNHLVVLVPNECGFGANGLGTVGQGWGSSGNTITSVQYGAHHTLVHEIGHNLGFAHSNSVKCAGSPPQTCGSPEEYADPYGVMNNDGTGSGHQAISEALLHLNGGQGVGEQVDISLAPLQTTYSVPETLQPTTEASGLRSLMVTDPVDGEVYFVEYRAGLDRDADSLYAEADIPQAIFPDMIVPNNGVTVLRCADRATELIPQPEGDHWLGAFESGQTFTSPSGGLTVDVTATNGADGAEVTVSLDGPAPTVVPPYTPPTPVISGVVQVGAQVSAYSPMPGEWQRVYRWTANGAVIPNSGSAVLTVTPDLLGQSLRVELDGRQCGHENVTSTSAPSTVAAAPVVVAPTVFTAATPTITGTPKVGKKLKVVPGAWSPAATLTYQWFVKGKAVKGATGKKLKLTKAMVGKKVTVKVTGTRPGYTTLTKTSKATTKVKAK